MAKNLISEERLEQLIKESIYEVLSEGQYDEGLGRWLGNAYQWARNKWNNFKGDFNAGRNYQRYKNRDYDSYEPYGDEADAIRNFGGREYGAYRYNLAADRRAKAKQYTTDKVGNNGGSIPKITPHPDLGGQVSPNSGATKTTPAVSSAQTQSDTATTVTPSPSTPTTPATPTQSTPATPTTGTTRMNSNGKYGTTDATGAGRKALQQAMIASGLVPQGNPNQPSGWKNAKGGKLTPQQKTLIQQWKRYKAFQEQLKKLEKVLNEVRNRKNNK